MTEGWLNVVYPAAMFLVSILLFGIGFAVGRHRGMVDGLESAALTSDLKEGDFVTLRAAPLGRKKVIRLFHPAMVEVHDGLSTTLHPRCDLLKLTPQAKV